MLVTGDEMQTVEFWQGLVLGLTEAHTVHVGSLLKLVQVSLNGFLSFRHLNYITELRVGCQVAEGAHESHCLPC